MLMTTVQWTANMQRQEEGPFRLKGLGVGNLFCVFRQEKLFCCLQINVFFFLFLFSRCCVYQSLFSLLTFDVLDAYVYARVRDLSFRLGNGPLQWGCVWVVSLHTQRDTHVDSSYSPAELHQITISLTYLSRPLVSDKI